MTVYGEAAQDAANLVQNTVDRRRKNAAYHALAQVYGPTAGDPELAAKLQNNAFAAQIDPLKVQEQQLANTGTQQKNDADAQVNQRNNLYTVGALLKNTGDANILDNPLVQKFSGLAPGDVAQVKQMIVGQDGKVDPNRIDALLAAGIGPSGAQVTGAGIPVQNPDGSYSVVKSTKAGGSITLPLNGAQPVAGLVAGSGIDNRNSQMQNRPILPNGQVNQPFVAAKTQIAAAANKAGITLSPEAIDMLADEGVKTGKIQTFGMGGGKNTAAIANRMAEKGTTGEQLAVGQQDYKSRQAYVTDLAKSSPTSAGGLSRSAGAVLAHIDTLDQMIDALSNKNVRLVNYLQQKYKAETGKAIPLTFDAQKTIVGDELTRYLIARGGTLHDRQQMQDSLARANSPAQLKSVISTYKDDIGAQLYSQYAQAKGFNADKQLLGNLTPYAREILTGVEDPTNHPTANQMNGAQPKGQLPGGFTYLGVVK